MSETTYSQVLGASSNGSGLEPSSTLESIAASHDAREGDSSRPPAPASSREKAALGIRSMGRAMSFVGQVLRSQERARAARYADDIAARIEHLAKYVDSPGFAARPPKRRPLPGSFSQRARLVGLVASRFLKRVRAKALRSGKPASVSAAQARRSNGWSSS